MNKWIDGQVHTLFQKLLIFKCTMHIVKKKYKYKNIEWNINLFLDIQFPSSKVAWLLQTLPDTVKYSMHVWACTNMYVTCACSITP